MRSRSSTNSATARVALVATTLTILAAGLALALVVTLFPPARPALAGPVSTGGFEVFCVAGTGNNLPWEWAVVDVTGTPVVAESGTVAGTFGATALVVGNFLTSINVVSAPTPPLVDASAAITSTSACPVTIPPEVELTVTYPAVLRSFSLQVGPAGGPVAPVGTSPVTFNPTIRLVPEPSVASGMLAGIVGVALLSRARTRRSA
jgi:hypothetical protein